MANEENERATLHAAIDNRGGIRPRRDASVGTNEQAAGQHGLEKEWHGGLSVQYEDARERGIAEEGSLSVEAGF